MNKLIVTVAPTSNFHGKDANPALPYTPREVADAVHACWNEGASIVHLHGRDNRGLPSNDPAFFQEADRLIRERGCDIVLQHSMAPANPVLLGKKEGDVDDGIRTTTTTPPPEMASLEVSPSNIITGGKVYNMLWDRLWAERTAKVLRDKGIKPEVEVYNNSDMDDVEYLIERGVLSKPYYRVGFEDNIYIERGKLAASNADLVRKVVGIAKAVGREIASPAETRETLGIPQLG